MTRRIVNEQAHRKGVFVTVSVVADDTATGADTRDAIRVATAKALDRFHEHGHFAVAGQITLPGL